MKQILHHSNNLLIALSVGLLFSLQSCGEKSVYNEYNKIATVGWDFGTPVRFETEINDTLSAYDITIQVRNNTDYAYQNFWIFVESTSPSGIVAKDTLEFLLADNTGKWLGKGISSTKEISGLYLENIKFPELGTYSFSLYQGMRSTSLKGIESVGLRIVKRQ